MSCSAATMPPTAYGSRSFTWCLPRPSSCSTASLSASRPKPLAAEIALVVAFQDRRAGRCKLRDQAVDDRDVIVALRVGAVDDVDEKIRVFQLLERGAEGLDQMVRQLGDEADRVRQQRLTGVGDRQLPRGGVERVEQARATTGRSFFCRLLRCSARTLRTSSRFSRSFWMRERM